MMKNHSVKLLLLVAAFSVSLTGCKWFKGVTGSAEADSTQLDSVRLTFCTVAFEDSCREVNALVQQNLTVDYPEPADSTLLADSIRAWLVQTVVAKSCAPAFEKEPALAPFKGDVRDGQALVDYYGRAGMELMRSDIQDMASDGFEGGYLNGLTAEVLVDERAYVTYNVGHEIYTGGAHGGFIAYGQTFRRIDGARMGWNMLDLSRKADIIALIKEGLKEYFTFAEESDGTPSMTDEQLMEQLMLYDNPDTPENELEFGIPLPFTEPYLVRDGIAFVYQQYEIAAYAAGLPSFTIPFDRIRPFLTPAAIELLEQDQ